MHALRLEALSLNVFARPNLIDDYHLLSYDELDSTNDEARRIAEGGSSRTGPLSGPNARRRGGRMGRHWVSAEGNLFCSILRLRRTATRQLLPSLLL